MKKYSIAIFIVMLFSTKVFADTGDIKCVNGNCDGWTGHYETITGSSGMGKYSGAADYIFKNNTGKPAFNIKIMLNFYDYFGTFIMRLQRKEEGPINVQIPMRGPWPTGASKVTFDIYYSEEYQPAK
jgi:hypothetical protein